MSDIKASFPPVYLKGASERMALADRYIDWAAKAEIAAQRRVAKGLDRGLPGKVAERAALKAQLILG